MTNPSYFSRKVKVLTFLLSSSVVFLHALNYAVYPLESGLGMLGSYFFDLQMFLFGLFSVAVPMFFLLSAYLFYRNFALQDLKRKYHSRFFSLVIPYFFWNLVGYLYVVLLTNLPVISDYINRPQVSFDLSSLFQSTLMGDYNILWFVRNLILFVLIAPLIHLITKNKSLAILSLVSLFTYNVFFPSTEYGLLYTGCFYLTGAVLAVHGKNFFEKRIPKNLSILSLVLAFVILLFFKQSNILDDFSYRALALSSLVFAIWCAFDLFEFKPTKYESWFTLTFFIYCTHTLILEPVEKVFLLLFKNTLLGSILDFIFAPILTLLIIYFLAFLLKRFIPRFYALITGGR